MGLFRVQAEPVGVTLVPMEDIERLPGGAGFVAAVCDETPQGLACAGGAEIEHAEADGAFGNIMPATSTGDHGRDAVAGSAEDRCGVSGGAVLCKPGSFTRALIDGPEVVPALLVGWRIIRRLDVQNPVAVEDWLVLFVEGVRVTPGLEGVGPDLFAGHVVAGHDATRVRKPDVLAIGDGRGRC